MRTRVLLPAAVGTVLVACAGGLASPSAAPPQLSAPIPCEVPDGFACRTLAVPLDHNGNRSGTLKLRVAAANNVKAPRGVLVLLTGGPGQPGVPLVSRVAAFLAPILQDYRLVMYDQRGTGLQALQCLALQRAMGSSDLAPPPAAAVRACASAIGSKRQFYGTDDVVADMDLLRRALGVQKWTLDGVSYGTYTGERYALAHPANVDKLVLDSVVPHSPRVEVGAVGMHATARVLRLACRSGCPGDPAADLAAVVRARHVGPGLLDALTLLSIVDPTYRTRFDVPALLHEARNGRPDGLNRFLAVTHGWNQATAGELSQGLHASTLCADWRYPWGDSSAPLAGRPAALARVVRRLPVSALWPFDRATASRNGFVRQCLPWSPTPATSPPPKGAKLTVPTLLVNGDHDLSTPLEWARQEAALAPNSRLVVVSGAGHSVQSRAKSDVGRRAVYAFLSG